MSNKFSWKIIIYCTLFFSLFLVLTSTAYAFNGYKVGEDYFTFDVTDEGFLSNVIKTTDKDVKKAIDKEIAQIKGVWSKEWWIQKAKDVWEEAGSSALQSAVGSALNTIAYDTATWLGSGNKGQKPMFLKEGWGKYFTNVADNAAGTFIETLGKNSALTFNLCEPDLNVKIKVGLGLIQYQKPKIACTFTKMKANWEKELQGKDFLTKFQDMFNPTSNDLGYALSLQTGMIQNAEFEKATARDETIAKQGWLDVRDPSGLIRSVPGLGPKLLDQSLTSQLIPFYKNYKNEYVAAANVFLNQLAITLFNRALKKLGENTQQTTSSYNWDGLTNPAALSESGGIAGAKEQLKKIIAPKFNVRGDYNILGELMQCPNPTKAGPTNCVIEDKFRQAIENHSSVADAIKNGYLKADGIFGFNSNGLEPGYIDGYPYRSMIILRKFRIVPVGWELAAQYIKKNLNSIGGSKNLNDLVACYDPTDEYQGYAAAWCQGLVDPKWLLKSPLNYCRREGPGPEIIASSVEGEGYESSLSVTRNDKYCADEQSCINESEDGSCNTYGYCTEERRKWNFESKDCEPKYNTCQTFKSSAGNTASYLENTLDYSGCSVDNAGCLAYCTDYNYATGNYTCTNISVGDKIYLDNGAEVCDAKNEGCHEFVRTKIGLGANLLLNSSFEESLSVGGWTVLSTATSTTSYDGLNSLELPSGLGTKVIAVAPAGYDIGNINGDVFTLSFYSNGCGSGSTYKLDASQPGLFDIATSTGWQFNQAKYVVPQTVYGNQLTLNFNSAGAGCLIDALKLERGYRATAYNNYQSNEKVYEKLIPGYLQPQCYDALGNLLPTAPAECGSFARMCRQEEVGCELFTSTEDKMAVPAKVGAQNYCVPECVNFKSYLATETYFDSSRQENFIPKTAKSCSAAVVGCDEFTNLDKVAAGGEAIENYSYLRQCVKPAASGASCGEFYTWEGSNESGFQLRVVSLDSIATAGTPDPRVTDPTTDANNCNETIYNLAPTDPAYNADCREFYNTSGLKFYHLYTLTVSCDEDCHPYRRTEVNIDTSLGFGDCSGADRNWADHNGDTIPECALCKNGGNWSAEHNACIYNAIPSQGRICQASAAGCREYTGSSGRNIRVVLNNDFEDGTQQNWTGASLSNESIIVGGRSLSVSSASDLINKDVSTIVQEDKSYILSFIAKSNGASSLSARFENSAASSTVFGTVTGVTGDWQIYELNLARLDHQVDAGEKLVIAGSGGTGDYYIDNIKLTEIVNRYYLIKNSWNTPAVCNADLSGNPAPNYMLGCEEYTDRDRQTHYLKSFAYLCSESAVGCELLIDPKNSSNPAAESFNAGAPVGDEVNIPADEYTYAVYDKKKQCNSEDKGCQRLGEPYSYASSTLYSDAYLKNNPDKYNSAMCTIDAANCGEYSTADGLSYFKNPGDQVCEWRQPVGATGFSWYRIKVKRCNATGDICLKDSDCTMPTTCQTETTDTPCDTETTIGEAPKTIGTGGVRIEQPDNNWAGYCPAEYAGCNELIDPVSSFAVNLFFNGDFSQNIDTTDEPERDGWDLNRQQTKIEPNTLYRLAAQDSVPGNNLSITCNNALYLLDPIANRLSSSSATVALPSLSVDEKSLLFYSSYSNTCISTIDFVNPGNTKVKLKKAAIDYQLKQELKTSECNGVVNFNDGCVLFNQRSQSGSAVKNVIYDADTSFNTPNVSAPTSENDSNVLLKVTPDRICDKWLACRSKIVYINDSGKEESYCSDIGLCNSVDDKGNCDNFLIANKVNQTFSPATVGNISNMDGYNKVGFDWGSTRLEGYYNFSKMKQTGEVANLPNSSFEFSSASGFPLSWRSEGAAWTMNVSKVIYSPYETQKECLNIDCGTYVPDGAAFLRLGAGFSMASELFDVINNLEYVLNAQLNTVNLAGARARVTLEQRNSAGSTLISNFLELDSGKAWEKKLLRIRMNAATSKIKIILSTASFDTATGTGNAYFDDINIMPALETYDLTPTVTSDSNYWYTPQSCRLYPENNALSCSYFKDSGVLELGWPGYCLEYDRAPGSQEACLMWWPVEKVKGDSVYEGAGYQGRYPVYYCTESESMRFLEYRHSYFTGTAGCGDGCPGCPVGYQVKDSPGYDSCFWGDDKNDCYCIPTGTGIVTADMTTPGSGDAADPAVGLGSSVNSQYDGWYVYDGNLQPYNMAINNTNPQVSYLCNGTASCTFTNEQIKSEFSPTFFTTEAALKTMMDLADTLDLVANPPLYCTELVQTVTQAGQNKYWSGRVYEGSSYIENCYANGTNSATTNCLYSADYKPFGSIVYPKPSNNPYEWDSKGYAGIQPLYYEAPDTSGKAPYQPRMGELHQQSELQRLFAKSYGAWRWATSSSYQSVQGRYTDAGGLGLEWDVPGPNAVDICPVSGRPTTASGDYCAILPIVSNVEIDKGIVNVTVIKNGFVNLTFNSTLDGQQKPLVMYVVDWADDEYTINTGMEMNDRPYTDKPHSLYHLYSYWDLKSKAGSGITSIDCSVANECRVTPRVLIKDNWGWCNGDTTRGQCSTYIDFPAEVIVREN